MSLPRGYRVPGLAYLSTPVSRQVLAINDRAFTVAGMSVYVRDFHIAPHFPN
jgi:hypothetical protein